MPNYKLTNIQILRGLAAVWVVLYHALGLPLPSGEVNPILGFAAGFGYFGVDIFFVLSGFVICYSVHGKMITAGAFFRRRAERIVPPYFILTTVLFIGMLAAPSLFHSMNASLDHFLRSIVYLSFTRYDFPVLYIGWTLEYEMLFYLLAALALAFGMQVFNRLSVIIALLIVGGVLVTQAYGPVRVFGFVTNPIILEFGFGFVIAGVFLTKRIDSYSMVALGVAITAIALINPTHRALLAGIPSAALLCICLAMHHRVTLPQFIKNPLSTVGEASYSIYLMQVFSLPLAGKLSRFAAAVLEPNTFILLTTGFTIFLGWVFFRYVETPILGVFRRQREQRVTGSLV